MIIFFSDVWFPFFWLSVGLPLSSNNKDIVSNSVFLMSSLFLVWFPWSCIFLVSFLCLFFFFFFFCWIHMTFHVFDSIYNNSFYLSNLLKITCRRSKIMNSKYGTVLHQRSRQTQKYYLKYTTYNSSPDPFQTAQKHC